MKADNRDYRPIDCGLHSKYELAIMHGRSLNICWLDEGNRSLCKTLKPVDILTRDKQEFLIAIDTDNMRCEIRLDRITRSDIDEKS